MRRVRHTRMSQYLHRSPLGLDRKKERGNGADEADAAIQTESEPHGMSEQDLKDIITTTCIPCVHMYMCESVCIYVSMHSIL